jgi:predicted O-methyltransferase YrrM
MTPLLRSFRDLLRARLDAHALAGTGAIVCDASMLATVARSDLDAVFRSDRIAKEWDAAADAFERMKITADAGGVNPGDRRAVFYLVRSFQPQSVLEIGTHIGASTIHIAAALNRTGSSGAPRLTTVDIVDVNDPAEAVWAEYGSTHSPLEMARSLQLAHEIEFVVRPSLDYLSETERSYDFIFLDGDHSAQTVYREVPAALRSLRPNGVILLHDYFPNLAPLWQTGAVIPGPWLAVERLRAEGAELEALPLGRLPWPTKLGTNTTSLAVLVRRQA